MKQLSLHILSAAVLVFAVAGTAVAKKKIKTASRRPVHLVVEKVLTGKVEGLPLTEPRGLAVDKNYKIVVCDAGNDRLIMLDSSLASVRDRGGYGSHAALMDDPEWVQIDNDLTILVSDPGNRRIARFDQHFNFVDEIKFDDDEDQLKFGRASGMAVTNYGETWIADSERNRIAVFDNVGQFDRFVGDFGYSGGQLRYPEKILIDPDDNFIVCDGGNERIIIYDAYGNFENDYSVPEIEYPISVALQGEYTWVLGNKHGKIACIDSHHDLVALIGPTIPGYDILLKNPFDLILLGNDRLVISDSGNDTLILCRIIFEN